MGPHTVEMVEMVRVVFARGAGTENDIVRTVEQFWTRDGELIAERDPDPKEIGRSQREPSPTGGGS